MTLRDQIKEIMRGNYYYHSEPTKDLAINLILDAVRKRVPEKCADCGNEVDAERNEVIDQILKELE